MSSCVLDASAVLAYLHREPGHDRIERLMEGGAVSAVNVSEVASKLVDRGVREETIQEIVCDLGLSVIPFDETLAYRAAMARIKTRFITAADLMLQLAAARRKDQLKQYLNRAILGPRLLVIDELGYLPFGREEANLLFQVIAKRYERGSIIITSNQSLTGWGEVFGDAIIATAILDRLLHHSTTLNIKGESYRLKEKRRAGLLGRPGMPVPGSEQEVSLPA